MSTIKKDSTDLLQSGQDYYLSFEQLGPEPLETLFFSLALRNFSGISAVKLTLRVDEKAANIPRRRH